MIPEIGTPVGSLYIGSAIGQLAIGAVKRALGWATRVLAAIVRIDWWAGYEHWPSHFSFNQVTTSAGGCGVIPSHHTSPSWVYPVLVNITPSFNDLWKKMHQYILYCSYKNNILHCICICLIWCSRCDSKESILRIDGIQLSVCTKP